MKKVLIVDDNDTNLYFLKSLLEEEGFDVIAAQNGQEALDSAHADLPDLIISDILMPVMDGYMLCRKCKSDEQLRQVPFVFYTATYTEPKDEKFALSLGADRFVLKPQEPEALLHILKECWGERSAAKPAANKPLGEEMEFFRQHNEILFGKLEKKMLDLEAANRKLKCLEEQYRLSFENVTDIVWTIDADLIIQKVSPSMEKMLGYGPQDFIGHPLTDFGKILMPKSMERAIAEIRLVLEGKTIPASVYSLVARDGTVKHGEISASPMLRDGKTVGMVSMIRDITRRKRAEEERYESESLFRNLFEQHAAVKLIIDPANGKIIDANAMAAEFYGWTREQLRQMRIQEINILSPEEVQQEMERARTRKRTHFEFRHRRADGSIRDVAVYSSKIEANGKELLHSIVHDITERKRAEESLRKSERLYRSVIENIQDVFYRSDREGRLLMGSPSGVSLFGYDSLEEMIGLPLDSFWVNPEDRPRLLAVIQDTGSVEDFEGLMKRKDGTVFWASLTVHFYRDEDGNFLGTEGIIRDVTERKRMEESLRENEDKFRLITDNVRDTIWLMDMNLQTTWMSASVGKARGFTLEELRSLPLERHLTPDSLQIAAALIEKNLSPERVADPRQEITVSAEMEFYRKDGSTFWADTVLTLLRDRGGIPIGFLGLSRDTTERRAMEEALRESEKKYRFLTEKMTDIVWMADMDLRTLYVTPSIQTVLGYSQEERMLQTVDQQLTPDSLSLGLEFMARELALEEQGQGNPQKNTTLVLEYYHKDGSTRWMETIIGGIRNDHGVLTGFHGVSRDITERKLAVEERLLLMERLQRAEKMEALGTLAGGVAHDLNNVLGVLVGYSELLADQLPADSLLRKHVDNILQSSIRGAAIIQDLLTLARRGVIVSEVVDLNRVVSDYLQTPELENLKIHHPQITILTELEEGPLNIKGSSIHLGKTVMNLVSNAAESISGRGEVTIRTQNHYLDHPIQGYDAIQEGDYAVLTVSDTGGGISTDDLGKIFEPFYTKKVMGRSGTGLGLAVVWGTVKDHHGYIDVQSEEDKGSTFTLYFPVTREELVKADKVVSSAAYMGKGEAILVVDDVQEQRELARSMLEKLGYQVEAVAGGEEAIAYLKNKKADLIVLDMIMDPGMDGMETYRRIREINPGQKAVIVSGFSETDRVRKTQEMGAGAFIRKPYILEQIGLAVRKELDRT